MYFFFFNDTATTEIYTLSLHDALPIWVTLFDGLFHPDNPYLPKLDFTFRTLALRMRDAQCERSEEHTSELQSQSNLVCRLLLEKKKKTSSRICLSTVESYT